MSLRVELISSTGAFKALKDDWKALFNACPHCKIFSSWEWMYSWWDVFNRHVSKNLFILCVYEDAPDARKLVGIAPFYIAKKKYPLSLVTGKTLQFIGNGEPENERILSQYHDLIVLPGKEVETCRLVVDYLQKHKKDWDCADFPYLLKNALIGDCFLSHDCWLYSQSINEGFRFYIPRVESFDDYKATLAKRWAKMYKKKNRLLERDGEVSITITNTVESVDHALQLLSEMHGERWRDAGCANKFNSRRFFEFHQKLLKQLVPLQKAFIKTIYLDDEPLASYYAFAEKGEVHYYQSGFFSKYANRYSPLFLLVCKEIGLSNLQNKRFDFMYTDTEESYKQVQYAAKSKKMYRLMVSHKKYRLSLFNILKTIKHTYLKRCDAIRLSNKNTKNKNQ